MDPCPARSGTPEALIHRISGVAPTNRPAVEIAELRAAVVAAVIAIAAGTVPIPYDGDAKSERRLSTLLWRWSYQELDWPTFLQCDDAAPDIGSQMWRVVMLRFMMCKATEIDEHFLQLHRKQRANERVQEWWVNITTD